MTSAQRTGRRLFFAGLAVSLLAIGWSCKIWHDYYQHAKWLWWQGRFMDPFGHAIFLQFGMGMIVLGYAFLAFLGLLRWRTK